MAKIIASVFAQAARRNPDFPASFFDSDPYSLALPGSSVDSATAWIYHELPARVGYECRLLNHVFEACAN
jgi:hypothetical protein